MIGEKIRALRKARCLSQKDLAVELRTSQGYICDIEKGLKKPGSDFLVSLKRFFDIDLNWLLCGEEKAITVEESPVYGKTDPVIKKINQYLVKMNEADRKAIEQIAATLAGKNKG